VNRSREFRAGCICHADSARPLFVLPGSERKLTKGVAGCKWDSRKEVGGGNDPQGLMEGVIVLPLLEAVPPVTPDPADPVLDPDVALDLDVVLDP
jgi:hypothetical protein